MRLILQNNEFVHKKRITIPVIEVIALLMVLGLLIYSLFSYVIYIEGASKEDLQHISYMKQNFLSNCTTDCNIMSCQGISENEILVGHHIMAALQNAECTGINELQIINSRFKNLVLNEGWLDMVQSNILKLELYNCPLKELNTNAFAGNPFIDLNSLTIINSDIRILQRHSFLGLQSLKSFAFRNYKPSYILEVEEKALDGMSASLADLELTKFIFAPESIINLTGYRAANLVSVSTIALSYNTIVKLLEGSFTNVPSAKALHLSNNGLNEIDQKTFWPKTAIQALYLSNNALEKLQDGVFNYLDLKAQKLFLDGNNWDCTCSLQWLKDFYEKDNKINMENPPLCKGFIKFEDIDFCIPGSTVSSSTSSTEETTTESNGTGAEYLPIYCRDQIFPEHRNLIENKHDIQLFVKNESIVLEFQELKGDPLLIKVIVADAEPIISDYHLIWFNSEDKSENGCLAILTNNTILSELKRDTTYTMSLMYKEESEVSPKATFGLTTDAEWALRTWIPNRDRIIVIGLTTSIGILLVILSIIITFVGTRKFYKSSPGDASRNVGVSKDYEKEIYCEPRPFPGSEGYLTPKYHNYTRVRYRPSLTRSKSECIYCTNLDYCNATIKLNDPAKHQIAKFNEYEDYRPPLPPPNRVSSSTTLPI